METDKVVVKGDDVSVEHGTVDIKLEGVTPEKREGDADTDLTLEMSGEQLMYLNISLRMPDKCAIQNERTHLIIVVDNSGSMAGNPWKQVQESLRTLIGSSITQEHVCTDLIVYNSTAKRIPIQNHNYIETIDGLRAGGMTNFVKAFDSVFDVISESRNQYTKNVVVFLTDGQDSMNTKEQVKALVPTVHDRIIKIQEHVIIHAVGFSKDHSFEFLKEVADFGGSAAGMFRYCEPGDDKTILLQKLQELFDFITNSEKTCTINVELLNEESNFVCQSPNLRSTTIKGRMTSEETNKQVIQITGDVWVSLGRPLDLSEVKVTLELEGSNVANKKSPTIPCIIRNIERTTLKTAEEKSLWRLKILERNMDNLMSKAANAVSNKADVSNLQTRVERYQKLISKTKVFGNGISRDHREKIFVAIKDIQKRLDEVHSMLAEYLRTGTSSLSLLARAHDMRYQAVFKKDRLQRVMDRRVSKNMQHASSAQQQLATLVIDTTEVNGISQDAKEFFYCILSQNSISDILLSNEKEDAIGFGLAVKRSEVVMDEPTLVRIDVISGTLVSRSSMLDALEYKINVSSHLKAHGGFTFENSVTTVGASREPINAWLPLYITPSHWDRIKILLKPCLGTFCTLDPLGYDYKQLDVMFSVLGAMVGQLSERNTGEHQLKLLFAVLKTCTACVEDFDLKNQIQESLSNFLSSPAGRTKDIIPNLYTIIGYALSLPLSMRQEIFKEGDSIRKFLLAIISEWLRRGAGSIYREASMAKISGILKALVGETTCTAGQAENSYDKQASESRLAMLCMDRDVTGGEFVEFDPTAGITGPDIEVTHSEHIDKAMELWAEKRTGLSENIDKTKRKAYQKAVIEVQKWSNVGDEKVNDVGKIDDNTGVDNKDVKSNSVTCNVTEPVLQAMSRLIHQLNQSSHNPHVTSLPGLIAFVTKWLTCQHDSTILDGNCGLVPDSLIQEMKDAVKQVYAELKDVQTDAEEDGTGVTADSGDGGVIESPQAPGSQTDATETRATCSTTCQTKTANTDDNDDDDLGYDIDDDDDDDDDEDDATYEPDNAPASNTKPKMDDNQPCLPKLLRIVDRNCDVVLSLRAMLCQAVRFHSNSKARTAIASKEMLDTADDNNTLATVMDINKKHLEELTVTARQNILNEAIWKRANHCMIHSTTPLAFIGYLMNTYTSRNEGFPDLIELFMTTVDKDTKPPCLKEKVHMLLTGKYLDCPVLDNGNQWLPERKMAKNFQQLLGDEIWGEFEAELRSTVQIHVYRVSDIPNRHGHCNSNPYIPNVLRKKLGMKLLPEVKAGGRRRRKRVS